MTNSRTGRSSCRSRTSGTARAPRRRAQRAARRWRRGNTLRVARPTATQLGADLTWRCASKRRRVGAARSQHGAAAPGPAPRPAGERRRHSGRVGCAAGQVLGQGGDAHQARGRALSTLRQLPWFGDDRVLAAAVTAAQAGTSASDTRQATQAWSHAAGELQRRAGGLPERGRAPPRSARLSRVVGRAAPKGWLRLRSPPPPPPLLPHRSRPRRLSRPQHHRLGSRRLWPLLPRRRA